MSRAIKLMRLVLGWVLAGSLLVSGSSGMVLCVADDGCFAVETESHRHYGHTHDEAVPTHDANALSDTSCASCDLGGCVDVPLGSDKLSHATKHLTHNRLLKKSAGQFFSDGVAGYRRLVYVTTSILAQSLLERRTIVLLI